MYVVFVYTSVTQLYGGFKNLAIFVPEIRLLPSS